jgi:hypothetical protein
MKTVKNILIAAFFVLFSSPVHAGLVAGKIDVTHNEVFLVFQDEDQMTLIGRTSGSLSTHPDAVTGPQGGLYVVDAEGGWKGPVAEDVLDGLGIRISLPMGRFDKVVYLDASGKIQGGLGLARHEMKQLVEVYGLDVDVLDLPQGRELETLLNVDEDVSAHELETQVLDRLSQANDMTLLLLAKEFLKMEPVDVMPMTPIYDALDREEGLALMGASVGALDLDISLPTDLKVVTSGTILLID